MTDGEMRIAIAEACGWKMFYQQAIDENWSTKGRWITDSSGKPQFYHNIPDYLNDLNAIYRVEETLLASYQVEYAYQLKEIACPITGEDWMAIHATARQRAEAFLKTIGKWRDA